jgi:uncharacterized protein YqeY
MYKEIVDKEIALAMKNGEQIKLTVWRSIKNEFIKFRTSGKNEELTDEKELTIIKKMAQQRKDSIEQYINAGRELLADVERKELDILTSLLPKEPTEVEISDLINKYVSSLTEKPSMKDMKSVMDYVKTTYPTVNGGIVSKIFKENFI